MQSNATVSILPEEAEAFIGKVPLARVKRDLLVAAATMGDEEAKFSVQLYYQIQDFRKAAANQERALEATEEPATFLDWAHVSLEYIETQIRNALGRYAKGHPVGQWSLSITGIGPVISAGLLAHIDIERAPTVGHIWRFAGLDPTVTWNKGEKRPWNADLKVLCVHPAGRVTTKRGIIPICEVQVGDDVLTHQGRWRSVTRVFVNEHHGPLYGLRAANSGNQVAWLTAGHPVYAAPVDVYAQGARQWSYTVKEQTQQPHDWHAVESVQARWRLSRPVVTEICDDIPSYELDGIVREDGRLVAAGRHAGVPAPRAVGVVPLVTMTPNLMRLFGLYIGEGHISSQRMYWSFHRDERDLIDFVVNEMRTLTESEPSYLYAESGTQIGIGGKSLTHLFATMFGTNGENMRFPMDWLSLPHALLRPLWDGIMQAEGDHSGKFKNRRISVKNPQLAQQIVALGRQLGMSVSLHTEPSGAHRIMLNERDDRAPRARDTVVMPSYTGYVYNLEVEEDHSYLVEGYAVHNCWKIGQSFMKVQNNPNDVYGKLYVARKAFEIARNDAGELAEQAATGAARVKKSTEAYKAYSVGKLPPGHIDARARRWVVKLYLSHWHEVAYFNHYGTLPVKPYVLEHVGGHVHRVEVPNADMIPGLLEARQAHRG